MAGSWLEQILGISLDWRFAASVLFFGSLLGGLIFRKIPAPRGSAESLRKMVRAGMAESAAKRAGVPPMELMAGMVGRHAATELRAGLRKQSRNCLLLGFLLAALLLLALFLFALPISTIPIWIYVVLAILGLVRTLKLW